jgi:hypothetical protein
MKTLLYISTLLLLISCGQKNNNQARKTLKSVVDTLVDNSKITDKNIELKKYIADGLLLKGEFSIFDNNLTRIGKLQITKIEPAQIIGKSTKLYNIDGSSIDCEKAYFIKIKYQSKEYVVFGQDIFEIKKNPKFIIFNEKKEKLNFIQISNFKLGDTYDGGLSGCAVYSILVLWNERNNHYSLIKFPENEDIHTGNSALKQAVLFHDDSADEKIYKVTMRQDTLVIGIKAIYQEGGSVFNLKTVISTDFPKSEKSDKIVFDTNENLEKKMDEIK